MTNNKHCNILLQRAWNKYWNVSFEFEILELCCEEDLIKSEQKWLDLTQCFKIEIGYNLTPTAGNSKGVKHSEETRKRMSNAKNKMTQETKDKMKVANIGRKLTKEHKAKISASNIGRMVSEETKYKIRSANKGRKASEETKKKISAGNKNLGTKRGKYKTKKTDEFFKNMSAPPLITY